MRVGWVADPGNGDGTRGGAELTMDEFRAAAPDGTEFVDENPDVWVVGNCVTLESTERFDAPVVKYVNDAWPWGDPGVREWLLENATCVFTSPLHRKTFRWNAERWEIIPPAVDVERFREARNGDARSDHAVHVGHFYWAGKGPQLLVEWAHGNETPLNIYGTGPAMPPVSQFVTPRGPLEYDEIPATLARYETFVHLPTGVEPFGRGVVEAHAAGCKVVANRNVGALYYLQEAPEKLVGAARDFWQLVEKAAS